MHNDEINASGVLVRLRAAGMRPTVARIGVLQALDAEMPARICADDLHRRMILRGTRASIGTVYRVIHQLEANGLVLREWDHSRTAYYRIKPSRFERPTHRILCRTCSHSVAFTDADFLARLADVAQSQGILIVAQEVTIQVDCAGCSGKPDDCRAPAVGHRRLNPSPIKASCAWHSHDSEATIAKTSTRHGIALQALEV